MDVLPARFWKYGYGAVGGCYKTTRSGAQGSPRKHKKWSGWQELNLRGHVPKTCGWPLDAHYLAQRVYHVYKSRCASITASMDLYAIGVSSMTSASLRHSTPAVALA